MRNGGAAPLCCVDNRVSCHRLCRAFAVKISKIIFTDNAMINLHRVDTMTRCAVEEPYIQIDSNTFYKSHCTAEQPSLHLSNLFCSFRFWFFLSIQLKHFIYQTFVSHFSFYSFFSCSSADRTHKCERLLTLIAHGLHSTPLPWQIFHSVAVSDNLTDSIVWLCVCVSKCFEYLVPLVRYYFILSNTLLHAVVCTLCTFIILYPVPFQSFSLFYSSCHPHPPLSPPPGRTTSFLLIDRCVYSSW